MFEYFNLDPQQPYFVVYTIVMWIAVLVVHIFKIGKEYVFAGYRKFFIPCFVLPTVYYISWVVYLSYNPTSNLAKEFFINEPISRGIVIAPAIYMAGWGLNKKVEYGFLTQTLLTFGFVLLTLVAIGCGVYEPHSLRNYFNDRVGRNGWIYYTMTITQYIDTPYRSTMTSDMFGDLYDQWDLGNVSTKYNIMPKVGDKVLFRRGNDKVTKGFFLHMITSTAENRRYKSPIIEIEGNNYDYLGVNQTSEYGINIVYKAVPKNMLDDSLDLKFNDIHGNECHVFYNATTLSFVPDTFLVYVNEKDNWHAGVCSLKVNTKVNRKKIKGYGYLSGLKDNVYTKEEVEERFDSVKVYADYLKAQKTSDNYPRTYMLKQE